MNTAIGEIGYNGLMRKGLYMLITLLALLLLAGCAAPGGVLPSPAVSPQPDNLPAVPVQEASPKAGNTPSSSGDTSNTLPLIIVVTPVLQNILSASEVLMTPSSVEQSEFVRLALEDLADRLNLPVEDVSLMDITNVVWPDGSLGCPQPGMFYTQALVDGTRIRLQVGDKIYHYHSARNQPPFYCENPSGDAGQPGTVDK